MSVYPPITVRENDRDRLFVLLDSVTEENEQHRQLYDELLRAVVVARDELPENVVTLGSSVRFRNEKSGKEYERVLTLPRDAYSTKGAVSILTPAGVALFGLTVGDEINWPSGESRLLLRLLEVRQP